MSLIGRKGHVIAGTLLAAIIFVFASYLPSSRRHEKLIGRIRDLEASVLDNAARLQSAGRTHDAWKQTVEFQQTYAAAVPDEAHIGQVLEAVSEAADALGLANTNVVPAEPVQTQNVVCMPIEITLQGRFERVFGFLTRIESLPRIVRVQSLELGRASEVPGELIASMTVFVFYRHV